MCLTVPLKIIKINPVRGKSPRATAALLVRTSNGVNKNKAIIKGGREMDISLLPSLKKGDYVLSQSNIAVKKISKKEADNILRAFSKFSSSKS